MFKNFSEFNKLENQLPLNNNESLQCAVAQSMALNDTLSMVRDSAQRYASAYAKVAVWDYSNAGHPEDVTSQGRLSVPQNILAAAKARITRSKNTLQKLMGAKRPFQGFSDPQISFIGTLAGAFEFNPSLGNSAIHWDTSEGAIQRNITNLMAADFDSVPNTIVYTMTAQEMADKLKDNAINYPRCAIRSEAHNLTAGAYLYHDDDNVYCVMYLPSTDDVFFTVINQHSYVGRRYDIAFPAGTSSWAESTGYSEFVLDPSPSGLSLSQVLLAIAEDVIGDTIEDAVIYDNVKYEVADANASTNIISAFAPTLERDAQNIMLASSVATPEQLEALEQALS